MIQIGQYHDLKVDKLETHGVYLTNLAGDRVLLPTRYVPEDTKLDDTIKVFIYKDSEERPIATTLTPHAVVGEFAGMTVKEVNDIGAFMDWGLAKDLLIPKSEQEKPLHEGDSSLVYVGYDKQTDRIYGSTKILRYMRTQPIELNENQEVELKIWSKTDLGWKVIINQAETGMLFQSDVSKPLKAGDSIQGYVKQIREDGKIDVTLKRAGYENIGPELQVIRDLLIKNDGFLKYGDHSDPEEIRKVFGMSKKTFKKAVGALYKLRLIKIEKNGIRLV